MEKKLTLRPRYIHIVDTTFSEKSSFETAINEDINILVDLGCHIVSFHPHSFGLSPMTNEMYIIYERNEGEGYVTKEQFEQEREKRKRAEK